MDINTGVLGLLGLALAFHFAYAYFLVDRTIIPTDLPWVPIKVGKERSFVNQTRDAGMFIERVRRTAIGSNVSVFSYKDSTNGYLEAGLTGICICPPKEVCPPAQNVIWSDGDANDQICDTIDAGGAFGGYDTVDFGGAGGNACDI